MNRLLDMKSNALSAIRRGRPIAWVPEWMGLGNLLYLGHWAYEGSAEDEDRRVLLHADRGAAVGIFPRLRERLFVRREDVRFTDRRVMPWSGAATRQRPDHIPAQAHEAFIRDLLLPDSPVATPPHCLKGMLVVNVRRGDYYSVKDHQDDFGMDQVEYIKAALKTSVATHGSPDGIAVVSDGLDWCKEALGGVLEAVAPTTYVDGDLTHDLGTIVHAERLIITNSTFSYWGGYIGDVLSPGREVIAPWFFSRSQDGGRATQLRPHWTALEGDFY